MIFPSSFSGMSFLLFDSLNKPGPQDYNNKMFSTQHPVRTNYVRNIFKIRASPEAKIKHEKHEFL